MFDFLFPNHPFGGHTLRLVAQAAQGGADAYAEEINFGGKQMLERGWAMLLVDTRGRVH